MTTPTTGFALNVRLRTLTTSSIQPEYHLRQKDKPMSINQDIIRKVTFRKYIETGELMAVFIQSVHFDGNITSYMTGYGFDPCFPELDEYTVPATEEEYASMKQELEDMGYPMEIV